MDGSFIATGMDPGPNNHPIGNPGGLKTRFRPFRKFRIDRKNPTVNPRLGKPACKLVWAYPANFSVRRKVVRNEQYILDGAKRITLSYFTGGIIAVRSRGQPLSQ